MPVPPRGLIVRVAGTADLDWFISAGRAAAQTLRESLERAGRPIESLTSILDFGCGCGRVIRHFDDLDNVELHGTDVDRRAVSWCRRNLPFAEFRRNTLAPPTTYDAEAFDFVYALSVFTHLPEELQFAWMDELRRILRPRGLLAVTTHGESFLGDLTPDEVSAFKAGRLVVRRADAAGLNLCAAYHPPSWLRAELARGFEVADFIPSGAFGAATQDLHLLVRDDV